MMKRFSLMVLVLLAALVPELRGQQSALTDDTELLAIIERLEATPIFTNMTTDQVYDIFERGQALGNRADVFTTVGDSNTTNGDFMRPLGMDNGGCDFGDYESLEETVTYFSAVPPREGQANSFTSDSVAADIGFSSA